MHYAFRGCSWFRISDVLQVACLSRFEGASVKPEAPRTSTFCMEAGTIGDTNVGAYTQQNMINKNILIGEKRTSGAQKIFVSSYGTVLIP